MLTRNRILGLILSALVVLGLSACGGGQPGAGSDQRAQATFLQSHKLDLILGDCSSYRPVTEAFVPTMVAIAENSAQNRRSLWAACFDGAPLRTLSWSPQIDFGDLPASITGTPVVAQRVNQARALGLRPSLAAMVKNTPVRVPGSGQLEALELAAQTAEVGRVFMITRAQIDQVDGVNLVTASQAQIARLIRRWVPRLRPLNGVQLWFIGVGFGAPTTASVRNAIEVFDGIADGVGATFTWSRSLPASFPTLGTD